MPERYNYATETGGGRLRIAAAAIRNECVNTQPKGYSIMRPKEIEYMLRGNLYENEREFAKMFPLIYSVVRKGEKESSDSADSSKMKSLKTSKLDSYFVSFNDAIIRNFDLEDLEDDVYNAIQDKKDLLEFGRVGRGDGGN